jgi:hypothetical protein
MSSKKGNGWSVVGSSAAATTVVPEWLREAFRGSFTEVHKALLQRRKNGKIPYHQCTVSIGPDEARDILSRNGMNRNLSESVAETYTDFIKSGEFLTRVCDLIISDEDVLLNGQHTLTGIIGSGAVGIFRVTFGLPKEDIPFMDKGKIRSTADDGRIAGIEHSPLVTGAARLLDLWFNDALETSRKVPSNRCLKIIEQHPDLEESAKFVSHLKRPLQCFVLLHYLAWKELDAREAVETFLEGVSNGWGLMGKGSPMLAVKALRAIKTAQMDEDNHRIKEVVLRGLFEGWNLFMAGRTIELGSLLKRIKRSNDAPSAEQRWWLKAGNKYLSPSNLDSAWLLG